MRKTIIAFVLSLSALTMSAQNNAKVELLKNEKWWGAFVDGGPEQPFSTSFKSDTIVNGKDCFLVPFMVSNKGRCIWSPDSFSVNFNGETLEFSSAGAKAEVAKGGNTLREAYLYCIHKNIWAKEGKPNVKLFPMPFYDTGLVTIIAPSEEELKGFAAKITAEGFEPGTILIPEGWQDWTSDGYVDTGVYPTFGPMVSQLEKEGFTLMLTVTPYIPAVGRMYLDAHRHNSLLIGKDGKPLVIKTPTGYYACLDMTSPRVTEIFDAKLGQFTSQYGTVKLFFDYHNAVNLLDGDTARISEYTSSWVALGSKYGASMYTLVKGVPTQWRPYSISIGDDLSWSSLKTVLRNIINAGFTGHIYPQLSLSAFADCRADEELLLRAMQMAVFMPIASIPPSTEMFSNETYKQALRRTVKLRQGMEGYMNSLMDEALATGEPVLRAMEYQFPGQGFTTCDDQYMLGSKYLVAPVLDASGKRTVRLPKGTWKSQDGKRFRGPKVVNADVSGGSFAVFELLSK